MLDKSVKKLELTLKACKITFKLKNRSKCHQLSNTAIVRSPYDIIIPIKWHQFLTISFWVFAQIDTHTQTHRQTPPRVIHVFSKMHHSNTANKAGLPSSKQFKYENAQWPEIRCRVVATIQDNLWCDVFRGSTKCPCLSTVIDFLGKPKIHLRKNSAKNNSVYMIHITFRIMWNTYFVTQ